MEEKNKNKLLEKCPHCGVDLSPWQKVLLNVDRVILCKNCWYRIILDKYNDGQKIEKNSRE